MALFHDCWTNRQSTLALLQQLLDDAKANEARERRAAIDIQRLFRGQFVRAMITAKRLVRLLNTQVGSTRYTMLFLLITSVLYTVLNIQKRRDRDLARVPRALGAPAMSPSSRAGPTAQARVRAELLRGGHPKVAAGYAQSTDKARLPDPQGVRDRNRDEGRGDATAAQREPALAAAYEQRAVEEAAQKELVEVTQNLHHLVSTHAISGVYNAPMLLSGPATSFGVPVEVHIRENTHALVANRLASMKPAKTLKPYPPSNKATIQASSAYGADLKEVRTQKKYHKLRHLSATDFQTVHNAARDEARKLNQPGINAGLDYLDDWNNPYKKRGVLRTKEDLLPKLTTLEKAPKKPFHLTYGGNKSKVLPNDRFDV